MAVWKGRVFLSSFFFFFFRGCCIGFSYGVLVGRGWNQFVGCEGKHVIPFSSGTRPLLLNI